MRYLLLMALATVMVCGGCGDDPSGAADGGTTDTDTDTDSDTDTDTDTDTDCTQGEYSGDFTITTQSDVATIAGYTSISGSLVIECPSCTDLGELSCLTSVVVGLTITNNTALTNLGGLSALTSVVVGLHITNNTALTNLGGLSALTYAGDTLQIDNNTALTNLDGLSALTSVAGYFWIASNTALPDCETCNLWDQLTNPPMSIEVHDNLDDACTPVPDNCP